MYEEKYHNWHGKIFCNLPTLDPYDFGNSNMGLSLKKIIFLILITQAIYVMNNEDMLNENFSIANPRPDYFCADPYFCEFAKYKEIDSNILNFIYENIINIGNSFNDYIINIYLKYNENLDDNICHNQYYSHNFSGTLLSGEF